MGTPFIISRQDLINNFGQGRVLIVARRGDGMVSEKTQTIASPEVIGAIDEAIVAASALIEACLPTWEDHTALARRWCFSIAMFNLVSSSTAKMNDADKAAYDAAMSQIAKIAKQKKEDDLVDPIDPPAASLARTIVVSQPRQWDHKAGGF